MNTDLLRQTQPSLTDIIRKWFEDHPGILERDEEVVVSITTQKRPSPVTVLIAGINSPAKSLEEVLGESYKIFEKVNNVPCLTTKTLNIMNCANIMTLRALVVKTEAEMTKYRDCGRKTIAYIQDTLKMIDPRLHLGMILDTPQT